MVRHLYRFYLYFVLLAMLIFATIATAQFLQPLLALTPLGGDYASRPDSASLVQATVFAIVTWLITGLLGGLHYWLIRRDMQQDPEAANSAIRSFFLNMTELYVAPLAAGVLAFGVLSQLGHTPAYDVSYFAAIALASLGLFAFLEWERQRTRVTAGAALAFQRLHLYGVQLLLVIEFTFAWLSLGGRLMDAALSGGSVSGVAPCGGFTGCPSINLLSLTVSMLWLLLCWVGYGYFNRDDRPSLLRQILHFASFAYGVVFLLIGAATGFDLILKSILRVPISIADIVRPSNTPDFVSALTFGLLVMAVYYLWLRMSASERAGEPATTHSILAAILSALLAVWFWWGVGSTLLNMLESLLPAGNVPQAQDWAAGLASILTGLAYLPLAYILHRWSAREPATAAPAWRGFLFALLGGGILAGAIGGAVALYALITSALGSPLDNWVHVARIGLAAVISAAIVVAASLWLALREQLFKRSLSQLQPPSPVEQQPASPTLESILDDLLAHKITRDEAASRIRALSLQPENDAGKQSVPNSDLSDGSKASLLE
ncbi:MAG TPA: hypothetical protein VFA41_06040 [Ktedonobacteraceae bacterium]|jgi:hypothetical protein|nr:hypothetical protein [Ktedonobacteraceae bacterium]